MSDILPFFDALRLAASEPPTPEQELRRRTADVVRQLVDLAISTKAPAAAIEDANRLMDEAAAVLLGHPRGDAYTKYPEPGCAAAEVQAWQDCGPVLGRAHPSSVPFHPRAEGEIVVLDGQFDRAHQGRPGYAHGGYIAAVFDQALGLAIGYPSATASLTVQFRRPTPTEVPLQARCWVQGREGRKVIVVGELRNGEELLAEAQALYIERSAEQLAVQFDRAQGQRPT